jgi:hypothetical protein
MGCGLRRPKRPGISPGTGPARWFTAELGPVKPDSGMWQVAHE